MINLLWVLMIITGIFFFIFNGRADELLTVMSNSAASSIELLIGLAGIMAVWSGIMKLCEHSGLVLLVSRFLRIPMKILFPGLEKKNIKAQESIVMNISTNLMGLSNAATPFGIKAMEELQLINLDKERASDYMVNFLLINAACIQLLPTTVISIMASLRAVNPSGIIIPTILTTVIALVSGLASSRVLEKFYK